MKLAELLTFFRLRNMVVIEDAIVHDCGLLFDDEAEYSIMRVRVKKDDFQHAVIIYRKKNDRISLINADIFYTRLSNDIPSRVYIEGATITQLERELISGEF